VVARDPISGDSTANLEPTIAYLVSRNPELVFVAGTSGTGLAVLREARRQNLRAQFMGGDGWTSMVSAGAIAEGVWIGTPFAVSDSSEALKRFAESFRRRFGASPDANAALAYDAARLAARAIEEVGPTRDAIRRWLTALDTGAGYEGLTGRLQFSDGGDAIGRSMVLSRVRGGVLQIASAEVK
jgi:branched-chain amino acid transport system substrate-binding protein